MADPRYNAAWRMAEQMKARARSYRGNQGAGGLKLLITWLVFGLVLVVGTALALCFLLIGWAMMPLLRHRMKKQAEQFGQAGQTHDGQYTSQDGAHTQQVLEGEYEVRPEHSRR